MADLNPLIRARRHAVEQKQKFLAELYRQAEQLADQKETLQLQLAEEREELKDTESAEMLQYFGIYSEAVKGRIREIEDSQKQLDARIEAAREDMREAFAELKKIEITQERREEEELTAFEKKESQLLDEMAIDNYRRRVEEE